MSLKRPTPARALKRVGDSRRITPVVKTDADDKKREKGSPVSSLSKANDAARELRLARLKEKLAKRAKDSNYSTREERIAQLKKRLEDHRARKAAEEIAADKKAVDATFEVTEENFKELIKSAVGELLRELGLVEEVEELPEETEGEEEINPFEETEPEATPEEEPEEEEEEEVSAEPIEELDEEKEGEDADSTLSDLLKDPKKKDALKALLDGVGSKEKAKDAAAVFTSRYEFLSTEAPAAPLSKPKNRYE